jgi:amino acid transporter
VVATTVAGVVWIVLMTWICYVGIELSARIQYALLAVEAVMLVALSVVALVRVRAGSAAATSIAPSWSWFNPFQVPSTSAFADGVLLVVFIYWGWDTAVSVNEETRDKGRTPGLAAIVSTILPTARTTLSMAVFRAIPSQFKRIHPRHLTPTWSTVGMGLASVAFYVLLVLLSSDVLGDTIASIGLLIAFYYGMTGCTCAWFFRHELFVSARSLLVKGVLPLLGAVMLLTAFVRAVVDYAQPDYGTTSWTLPFPPHWQVGGVFLTGIGSLLLGLMLMIGLQRGGAGLLCGTRSSA